MAAAMTDCTREDKSLKRCCLPRRYVPEDHDYELNHVCDSVMNFVQVLVNLEPDSTVKRSRSVVGRMTDSLKVVCIECSRDVRGLKVKPCSKYCFG